MATLSVSRGGGIPLRAAAVCDECCLVVQALRTGRCPLCGTRLLVHVDELLRPDGTPASLDELLRVHLQARVEVIQRALVEFGGNHCAAARALGVHRNTVRRIVGRKSDGPMRPIRNLPQRSSGRAMEGN